MPSCEDGAAPVLSGDGTERAMLIGQAPGWREIETGLPFAWDAGKRLCGWLAAAGIDVDDFRERWYVTSIGKCYPGRAPGSSVDRPPSRADIARWTPFLREEVRLVRPRAGAAGRRARRIGSPSAPEAQARRPRRPGADLGGGAGRIGPVPAASVRCIDLAQRPGSRRALAAGDRAPARPMGGASRG